jgi:formylglycine-generating enzyme
MPERDLYQILQVSPEADYWTIRASYRALVKRYHPDAGLSQASNEMMQQLNEAFAVLSDAERRRDYDGRRAAWTRRSRRPQTLRSELPATRVPLTQAVDLSFVRVPAGSFLMGHDRGGGYIANRDDEPQHILELPDFLIGQGPVTVAQFAAFVEATGYVTTAEQEGGASSWPRLDWLPVAEASWREPYGRGSSVDRKQDHPVTVVTWDDARAFCRWASEVSGLAIRLPSEAEWEKAARGEDGRIWPWGDAPADQQRLNLGQEHQDTSPVGSYSPAGDSPYGCVDITGNVWQWTHSAYQRYPYRAEDGREDPTRDYVTRVLRGGAAWSGPGDYVVYRRESKGPLFRSAVIGFRVAAEPTDT